MTDKPQTIPNHIKKLFGNMTFDQSLISNITDGWARKSNWDDKQSARDFFQNMYDGVVVSGLTPDDIKEEELTKSCFCYSADVTYDIERLFWLGSDKDDDITIGQVGEGFKLAALSQLRDRNVRIFAASGKKAVEIRITNKNVSDEIELSPLAYDFYTLKKAVKGNYLIVDNAPESVMLALHEARFQFFYPQHPAIGEAISGTKKTSMLYKRTDKPISKSGQIEGLIFYHNQLRGTIKGFNGVIVVNKRYKSIDTKIGQDRDRRMFDNALRQTLLNHASKSFVDPTYDFREKLLELSADTLSHGNAVLQACSKAFESKHYAYYYDYEEIETRQKLKEKYYPKSYTKVSHPSQEEFTKIQTYKALGYTEANNYLKHFGVLDIQAEIRNEAEKQKAESYNKGARQPSKQELAAIDLVLSLPGLPNIAKHYDYHIFQNETLLGEYTSNRQWNSVDIYLGYSIFEQSTGVFISTVLHEMSHCAGYDGSRAFTDALTQLIEVFTDNIETYTSGVTAIIKQLEKVKKERSSNNTLALDIDGILRRKDPVEMAGLIEKIPHEELVKAATNLSKASAK